MKRCVKNLSLKSSMGSSVYPAQKHGLRVDLPSSNRSTISSTTECRTTQLVLVRISSITLITLNPVVSAEEFALAPKNVDMLWNRVVRRASQVARWMSKSAICASKSAILPSSSILPSMTPGLCSANVLVYEIREQ